MACSTSWCWRRSGRCFPPAHPSDARGPPLRGRLARLALPQKTLGQGAELLDHFVQALHDGSIGSWEDPLEQLNYWKLIYFPATVMRATRNVGVATEERRTRSSPTASIDCHSRSKFADRVASLT